MHSYNRVLENNDMILARDCVGGTGHFQDNELPILPQYGVASAYRLLCESSTLARLKLAWDPMALYNNLRIPLLE